MKRNLLLFLFAMAAPVLFAQTGGNVKPEGDSIIPPRFAPGEGAWLGEEIKTLDQFLKMYLQYPGGAGNTEHIGTEVVEFVVTAEGKVKDFNVINSVSGEVDREMIRALSETDGLWEPGTMNGMPIPMKKEVSHAFAPDDTYNLVEMAKEYMDKGNEELFTEEDPKDALYYFDRAVTILPYDKTLLSLRSLCKYELGDKEGAREDWERIVNLNIGDATQLETGYLIKTKMRTLDGYEELNKVLAESGSESMQ